jgi:hypothetical protein
MVMYEAIASDPTDVKDAEERKSQLTVVEISKYLHHESKSEILTRDQRLHLATYQQGQGAVEKTPSETRSGIHGW